MVQWERREVGRAKVPALYANDIYVQTSIWDITLRLGQIVSANAGGVCVRPVATLVLSPALAKEFAMLLTRQIADYERDYGTLPSKEDRDDDRP